MREKRGVRRKLQHHTCMDAKGKNNLKRKTEEEQSILMLE